VAGETPFLPIHQHRSFLFCSPQGYPRRKGQQGKLATHPIFPQSARTSFGPISRNGQFPDGQFMGKRLPQRAVRPRGKICLHPTVGGPGHQSLPPYHRYGTGRAMGLGNPFCRDVLQTLVRKRALMGK